MKTLLFVAGPSGSGKSRLARMAGTGVATMSLDDFYRDHDYPGMPQTLGITDWDDPASWNLELALGTLRTLVRAGVADLPSYDLSLSRRTGMHQLDASDSSVIVAEGIFAPETYIAAGEAGLACEAIWLDRPRVGNFSRRLARDLREKRKSPSILVRRGLALYRKEPDLRRSALAAGFRPMSMRQAARRLAHLVSRAPGH